MSDKKEMSRRTFLMYSLMGTGGFMAATMLTPMVRMAIDPALKAQDVTDFVAVGDVSEFSDTPKRVDYKVRQVDGWYESDAILTAWVTVAGNDVLALSPVCKHLGCVVTWEGNKDLPNEYFCPCHYGRYEKNGKNIPGTPPPAPLDEYEAKIDNGKVYLGPVVPNRHV